MESPGAPAGLRFAGTVTAAAGLAVYALSAISGPVLARTLGPAGRGDLAAVTLPTEMFGWLLAFGLPATVYLAREREDRQLLMSAWVFAVVVGGVMIAAVWALVPRYLSGHAALTVPWFRIFLFDGLLFVPMYTAVNLLLARGRVIAFNVLKQLSLVLNTVVVVVLAVAGRLTLTTAARVLPSGRISSRTWPSWRSPEHGPAPVSACPSFGSRCSTGPGSRSARRRTSCCSDSISSCSSGWSARRSSASTRWRSPARASVGRWVRASPRFSSLICGTWTRMPTAAARRQPLLALPSSPRS